MEHPAATIAFGPFRLAPDKRELWKDEVLLKVRAMPLTVLTYFAQHPERVIPIDEVRKAVWGGTRVGRGAVRVCVREIRQALGDEAATPHYIETVGRQGYRFIGGVGGLRLETNLPSPQVSSLQSQTSLGASGSWRSCNSGLHRRNRGNGR